jgi:hypothetical protein
MTKPKLDEAAMLAEMGPVAAFTHRSKPKPEAPLSTAQERGASQATARPEAASAQDGGEVDLEAIRAAVRQLGKETASYRFSDQEKSALVEIVYTYRRQNIRTSENKIVRIGLNWLIADYQKRGQASVLADVLTRLNQ